MSVIDAVDGSSVDTALQLGHHDSRVTFVHYRELVRPKEAECYWNIKPAPAAKVVPMQTRKGWRTEKLRHSSRARR
jgi:hypothetical protein